MKSRKKNECIFSSIWGRPQRNAHLRFNRDPGEEDETIYIRSSMEEEPEEPEDSAKSYNLQQALGNNEN